MTDSVLFKQILITRFIFPRYSGLHVRLLRVQVGREGAIPLLPGKNNLIKVSLIVKASTPQAMLKQEMGWYDQEKNNTGALCARLSTSAEVFISDLFLDLS